MNNPVPSPTPIFRFLHIDNLHIYLKRKGIYAPNNEPDDGLIYRKIHDTEIQAVRHNSVIPCGPCGVIHDYIPFYFGYLSPMMLKLKSGQVEGYDEGQEPLIYLVTSCQSVEINENKFVFSDGHGIARFTTWYDSLDDLDKIDWAIIKERYWRDTGEDLDRQRRKQAEFLVYKFCEWSLIEKIAVININMKKQVEDILYSYSEELRKPVTVESGWYY